MSGQAGATRLTPQQVIHARERRAAGDRVADIARDLCVTECCISLVTTGKSHKRIGGPLAKPRVFKNTSTRVDEAKALRDELVELRPNAASAPVPAEDEPCHCADPE